MEISKSKQSLLTYDEACKLFKYKDGQVIRRVDMNGGVKAGDIVCSKSKKGYHALSVYGEKYKLHRLVWLLNYKEWPNGQIDHINRNKSDNSIGNLRIVSNAENCKNQRKPKNNVSGQVGVSWASSCNKWMSNITVNRKRIYLGVFNELYCAVTARKKAEIKYKFHPNHGRLV